MEWIAAVEGILRALVLGGKNMLMTNLGFLVKTGHVPANNFLHSSKRIVFLYSTGERMTRGGGGGAKMSWEAWRHQSSCVQQGGVEKKFAPTATKKRKGGGSTAPKLCEVCLRPSAIFADVTHAVGVADLVPATKARLFAPFAVVVAVLAPEAHLFAPFGHLNIFL